MSVKQISHFFITFLILARHFITRALLTAENFVQAQTILRDRGVGAADGCSINMTFLKYFLNQSFRIRSFNFHFVCRQDGDRMFHNVEMGPAVKPNDTESQLNILTASPGETIIHCNRYLRLKVPEVTGLIIDSSVERHETFSKFKSPKNKNDVIQMLGDTNAKEHAVFRDQAGKEEFLKTICVGVFDLNKKTLSLYKDNPKTNEALVVLPLVLKDWIPKVRLHNGNSYFPISK